MANELIEKLETEFPQTESNSFQMIDVKASHYSSCLPEIMKSIKFGKAKVCIVSLSRQGEKVLNELSKQKINSANMLVLSGINSDVPLNNVKVFQPQWDVNALKNLISFAVKDFGADIFVFDSVSNLTLFLSKEELVEFFQKFIGILKARHMQGFFINISEETPDDIGVRVEGLMAQRIELEKFLGRKMQGIEIKKTAKEVVNVPTEKQAIDVKSLKKSISDMIKEEAKKISMETRKNLQIEKEYDSKKQNKTEKEIKLKKQDKKEKAIKEQKQKVHELEKQKEKMSLERKLDLLQKSFELGVISEKAFNEGKRQIKEKMSKL